MRRIPRAAALPLALALFAFIAAMWLGLTHVPKPSWASDPNAGNELRMIFCVAPLMLFALAMGAAGGLICLRRAK